MGRDDNIDELIIKTSGIELDQLKMSIRLYNCLRRGGYNSLTDIMIESFENFRSIRNFGKSCEQELYTIIRYIKNASREEIIAYCNNSYSLNDSTTNEFNNDAEKDGLNFSKNVSIVEYVFSKTIDKEAIIFINKNGNYLDDIKIENIELSAKTKDILNENGLDSLKKISSFLYSDLLRISYIRKYNIEEILKAITDYTVVSEKYGELGNEVIDEIVNKTIAFFSDIIDEAVLWTRKRALIVSIVKVLEDNQFISVDSYEFMGEIAKLNPIKELLEEKILLYTSEKIYNGIDKNLLVSLLSGQNIKYDDIIEFALDNMNNILIRYENGKIFHYKKYLNEWIETLVGNQKIAIESRCNGLTLEESGSRLGLTRERIRQITGNALRNRPCLYEEDYNEFFSKYCFSKEEFSQLFNLTLFQVNYLLLINKRGTADIQDFLDDDTVPSTFKDRVPMVFKGKVIVIDGECVPVKREILVKRILQTYFSDIDCTAKEFESFYYSFLEENKIIDNESLFFSSSRAIEARLADYSYTIAKANHKFRYYDTEKVDINELLDLLDITRYQDMEISTLKLMRDWPDVMDKYDLRDEYELHNLIRKKGGDIKRIKVAVTRMPLITIGNGNRDKQVETLFHQLAPISNVNLAEEYEKLYGVRAETVMANFFSCINMYFYNGMFSLGQQELDANEFVVLKKELNDDMYLWDEVINKYISISSNPQLDAINALTLKKLGFKVYSRYVINADYSSADSYFTKLLLKDKCIDLNEIKQGLRSIQAFATALNFLRDTLELIEVGQDVYYRFDFFAETYKIESKDSLIVLGNKVLCEQQVEDFFSVDAIANEIKIDDYNGICKNLYILNSIIRAQKNFKTSKVANIYLGTKIDNELSQIGLIKYIVKKYGDISINSIADVLENKYKIFLDRSRIIYLIQGSEDLYYDDIFDNATQKEKRINRLETIFIENSRFSEEIMNKSELIRQSNMLIVKYYWHEKYAGFVEYCGMNECFYMKDLLKLDLRKLSDNASRINISKGSIAEIVNDFMNWVKSLTEKESYNVSEVSIIDLFFK